MDRSPYAPWASSGVSLGSLTDRFGTIWFYELDTGTQTLLTTPQGKSRGPFVRVTKEPVTSEFGPCPSRSGPAMAGTAIR